MDFPAATLLKYDHPILVSKITERKSPRARSVKVSPEQSAAYSPVPPPPRPKSLLEEVSTQQTRELLNVVLPPREWMEGNQLWLQQVSSTAGTSRDVLNLQDQLDLKLQQSGARELGICPVRRKLFSQCFDELIRQATIGCAERGLLLLRVRDEHLMTIAAYQTLYESSVAFGTRKALEAVQGKEDMEKRICDLEAENRSLERQVSDKKAEREAIKKRVEERRQAEEKKYAEEVQLLKRRTQQLKAQLMETITSFASVTFTPKD